MTVHVVPIEPLDQRYTAQWGRWFKDEFARLGVDAAYYEPIVFGGYDEIKDGQFLDVVKTNAYKAAQLHLLCAAIQLGHIKAGDIILFHDLWFPGLEMLFYIRDGLKLDFKIAGVVHAGTYDPHDFLSHCGMERWAAPLERLWFNEVDCIFLSCEFHKALLESTRFARGAATHVHVSGLPIMARDFDSYLGGPRQDNIVFPHRLAPEKQPELFDETAESLLSTLPTWHWIKTQSFRRTKEEYCQLLASSKVAVSMALQETWGIGMQEAAYLGCIPIVPARLAYLDIYPERYRYSTRDELHAKILWAAQNYDSIVASDPHQLWLANLKKYNDGAIARIADHLHTL